MNIDFSKIPVNQFAMLAPLMGLVVMVIAGLIFFVSDMRRLGINILGSVLFGAGAVWFVANLATGLTSLDTLQTAQGELLQGAVKHTYGLDLTNRQAADLLDRADHGDFFDNSVMGSTRLLLPDGEIATVRLEQIGNEYVLTQKPDLGESQELAHAG